MHPGMAFFTWVMERRKAFRAASEMEGERQ
jgi:hypothetical protein